MNPGEDYLYPKESFVTAEFSQPVRRAVASSRRLVALQRRASGRKNIPINVS